MDVKSKLYSYYLDILNEISLCIPENEKLSSTTTLDYQKVSTSDIIDKIKESTEELINTKISQYTALNKGNKTYYQLENYTKKIEYDLKYYLRLYFEYKIQNDALEEKIKIYRAMQEEFEELKAKVKYEEGRFLNNEKKDNEIIILRQENTILKQEISKFEKFHKLNQEIKTDYLAKMKNMQIEIDQLKKSLEDYQTAAKNNEKLENTQNTKLNNTNKCNNKKLNKTGLYINNINNNENNSVSKWLIKHDLENVNSIISNSISNKNNLNYLKKLKNIFPKNTITSNKRPSNYEVIKNLYMNSNNSSIKNIINSSSMSTVNTKSIFSSNYNKIINKINHNKNGRQSLKKKYVGLKQTRKNNSMKIDKEDDNRSKSLSVNKYIKSNCEFKSDKKMLNAHKINFKPVIVYPLSCKHKTSSKLKRFKNKKIGLIDNFNEVKIKKNISALNIRVNSK